MEYLNKIVMVKVILRFIGAIVAAMLFDYLVSFFHFAFFCGAAHFFANLSWSNWFSFDILRGFLLPIVWGVLCLIGTGLTWIVKGSKIIAALPIIILIRGIILDFDVLFLNPIDIAVDDIGLGFWYYFGAVLTFLPILIYKTIYIIVGMFAFDE